MRENAGAVGGCGRGGVVAVLLCALDDVDAYWCAGGRLCTSRHRRGGAPFRPAPRECSKLTVSDRESDFRIQTHNK